MVKETKKNDNDDQETTEHATLLHSDASAEDFTDLGATTINSPLGINNQNDDNDDNIDRNVDDDHDYSSTAAGPVMTKTKRNKWREEEDIALMISTLACKHLLVNLEYYKPMKNFWIRVSAHMRQNFFHSRNHRQCHDRFMVLYSRGTKLSETVGFLPTYKSESLLLEIKSAFKLTKGNVTLSEGSRIQEMPNHQLDDRLESQSQPAELDLSISLVHRSSHLNPNRLTSEDTLPTSHAESVAGTAQEGSISIPMLYETIKDLQDQVSQLKHELLIQREMVFVNQKRMDEFYAHYLLPLSVPMMQQQMSGTTSSASSHQTSNMAAMSESQQAAQSQLSQSHHHHHHHQQHQSHLAHDPSHSVSAQPTQESYPFLYDLSNHYQRYHQPFPN